MQWHPSTNETRAARTRTSICCPPTATLANWDGTSSFISCSQIHMSKDSLIHSHSHLISSLSSHLNRMQSTISSLPLLPLLYSPGHEQFHAVDCHRLTLYLFFPRVPVRSCCPARYRAHLHSSAASPDDGPNRSASPRSQSDQPHFTLVTSGALFYMPFTA